MAPVKRGDLVLFGAQCIASLGAGGADVIGGAGDLDHRLIAAYRAQDWDASEAAYRRAAEIQLPSLDPSGLRDVFLERIAEYRENPPGEDWDGVYVATSK